MTPIVLVGIFLVFIVYSMSLITLIVSIGWEWMTKPRSQQISLVDLCLNDFKLVLLWGFL